MSTPSLPSPNDFSKLDFPLSLPPSTGSVWISAAATALDQGAVGSSLYKPTPENAAALFQLTGCEFDAAVTTALAAVVLPVLPVQPNEPWTRCQVEAMLAADTTFRAMLVKLHRVQCDLPQIQPGDRFVIVIRIRVGPVVIEITIGN